MAFPTNIGSGRVIGQFIAAVMDDDDPDQEPNYVAAMGTILLTPSIPYFPNVNAAGGPVTITPAPVAVILDADGIVSTPTKGDPSVIAYPGVRVFATNDPDASVQNWTWDVTYNLSAGGVRLAVPPHSIAVLEGATVDLSTVIKVPASPGIGIPQYQAAVFRAEAAAVAAAESAATSGEAALPSVQSVYDAAIEAPTADDTPVITMTAAPTLTGVTIGARRVGDDPVGDVDMVRDTHFLFAGARNYSAHPANPTDSVYPDLLTGGEAQWARYTEQISFITDPDNDVLEVRFRGLISSGIGIRIAVDGKWVTYYGETYSPSGVFFVLKLQFPSQKSRRIQVAGTGGQWCFSNVTVPTGQTVKRPPEPKLTLAWVGDSFAGGVGSYPTGASRIETACNYVAKMMGLNSFYHLGVGGTGWITANPFSDRITEALTYDPDVLVIDGSNNDPTNPVLIGEAVLEALELAKKVPLVFVAGSHMGGVANNEAMKSATLAKNRIFLDYLEGDWYNSMDTLDDGVHPTFAAHQKIARGLFAGMQPHLPLPR